MDAAVRDFIESATLLFIASRSPEGALDVSPRGGQPSVLWPDGEGRLLLPDYMGNRRLDTIANLLGNPDVVVALLSRGSSRFLKIRAHAEVSTRPEDIARFPADQNRPMTVIALKPHRMDFVESRAFDRSGFWLDPSQRKAPLDMMGYYYSDKAMHGEAGRQSIQRPGAEEARLAAAGMREIYGTPSEVVRTKVYDSIGSGGLAFIDEASFIALATDRPDGGIDLDLHGDGALALDIAANRQRFRLRMTAERAGLGGSGECALLAAVPGRCEALRMNGPFRSGDGEAGARLAIDIAPDEIFFHCSAALTRSQIWAEPKVAPWTGLRRFAITSLRQENPEVRSFVLEPLDAAAIGDIRAGQYVTVASPKDENQPQRRRNYSVSGRPGDRAIRISVRKVSEDGLSGLLHGLAEGDEVHVGVPSGRFVLDGASLRPVVLASAGVGITPLLPMLATLATDCIDRDIWFVHAARDARHALFVDEVWDLAERSGGRVRLFYAYSQAGQGEPCDHRGRLDAGVLDRLVPAAEADFYICGPDSFMSGLRDGLIARGADPERVRFEAFGPTGEGLAEKLAGRAERRITFAKSGKELVWRPACGSLLDLALSHQIKVDYYCRVGDCQSCVQKLVSGAADYPAGEAPVLAEGQVLLCQAVPDSDMVIAC